jgi:tRNA(Ile)-lysidine synthase
VLERAVEHLPDTPLVVALSGGADSAACGWVCVAAGRAVRAVTVDHGLPASAGLVAAARAIAEVLGLDHEVVPGPAPDEEDALRKARYAAVEAVARPGEALLTGHTADDQAETVLANLVRGAGAAGIAGIPRRRGPWVRPLLDVEREEARTLAAEAGLPFVDDPGNEDPAHRRVRLRTEVMPLLEELAPGARASLRRAASLAEADERALARRAAAVPVSVVGDAVRIPAAALAALPEAVAARVARRALRMLLHPYPGTRQDAAAVLAAVHGEIRRVSGGIGVAREGPWVVLLRPGEEPEPPGPVHLDVPGSALLAGWQITARRLGEPPRPAPIGLHHALLPDPGEEGFEVRPARPGDTIALVSGSKDVGEALREAGVPARLRGRWPVLTSGARMAWVVSVRRAAGLFPDPHGPVVLVTARRATGEAQ